MFRSIIFSQKNKERCELFIQVLIVFSVVCFTLETQPNLDDTTLKFLVVAEIFAVMVFTLEYIVRIYMAENKLRYIFSFYGLIDLLTILPFYLALFVDLRTLKILRLIRILRILKLGRYNHALIRLTRAFTSIKEELMVFFLASVVMIYLSSVGIYYFEREAQPEVFKSIFECLWWSVITLTTVGYGDIYPITMGGRFFTFIILMIGLGLVSVPTALIASSLTALREKDK